MLSVFSIDPNLDPNAETAGELRKEHGFRMLWERQTKEGQTELKGPDKFYHDSS